MNRKHLFLVALVAALGITFAGATSAFGASVQFNHTTGEMTYVGNDLDSVLDNNITISKDPVVSGWYFIDDTAGVDDFEDQEIQTYCYGHDYHGSGDTVFWEWSCPATHITIKGEKGDDKITVDPSVTIPTQLEGGSGVDTITGGGGNDVIYGGCSSQFEPAWPCGGWFDVLNGGGGADEIHGGDLTPNNTPAGDFIHGGNGPDTLDGGAGNDIVHGDDGNDMVAGGPGSDEIWGDNGTADIADYSHETGNVTASLDGNKNDGQAGENDVIEPDVEGIQGGDYNDTLYGNEGVNFLKGGYGQDYLVGYGGPDALYGEQGADLIRPGFGEDTIYGGSDAGTCCPADTVTYSERWNPVNVSLDGAANDGELGENDFVAGDVENITGGGKNDFLTGDKRGNVLSGGEGNDTLVGNGGGPMGPNLPGKSDQLLGEGGQDILYGGPAGSDGDLIDGGAGTDLVTYASRSDGVQIWLNGGPDSEDDISGVENATGGSGNDTMVGNDSKNSLFGGDGIDSLWGEGDNDVLHPGDGNDTAHGGDGNDVVAGDKGDDVLSGGPGGDLISGHEGQDTATYDDRNTPVYVTLDDLYNDGSPGESDKVMTDVETVIGGSAGDRLTGGPGSDTLIGGGGPDKLFGLAGIDRLVGGLGDDQLDGGSETDIADFSGSATAVTVDLSTHNASGQGADNLTSVETVYGSNFDDTLKGDDNPNQLSGFEGKDTLMGRGGADHLFGGAGDDVVRGGLGDDELSGNSGIDTVDYTGATGAVTVDLSHYPAGATGADGNDWLSFFENVTGSAFGDSLTGDSGANVLTGGNGPDKLFGLAGKDTLVGGAGLDSLDGGLDTDSCLNGETLANCP